MNLENIEVKLNTPYPKIENAVEDKTTVAILKNLLASRSSELTAVLQYSFQSSVADKTHAQIADILQEIAIVEMMHMDMLMHAITAFGGVPRYEDSQGISFNAGCVFYSTKLKEMLNANIASEQRAVEDYTNATSRVRNESLKNLFRRIIQDEELHIKIFKQIKDNVQFLSI